MNSNIQHLYEIARKPSRLIIGLMSGTSLDGLDIAVCRFEGSGNETKLTLLQFETVSYDNDFKQEVKTIFSKKEIDLEKLCLLNPWIALQHAAMINNCLKKWGISNKDVDLVASHGQTIYHAPKHLHQQTKFGNSTLQIGDGDHLAVATGIITISDFRQKNIACGGEGAPLAVYGDNILFSKPGEDRILLNIGGIANFTFLPGNNGDILCTDTGPGNTLMDAYMQQQFPGKYFDQDATVAVSGLVDQYLLSALKEHPFFSQPCPKTTGPELFNLTYLENAKQQSNTQSLSVEDTMATLNQFTAESITTAIKDCIKSKAEVTIFMSGGGIHNPLLVQRLRQLLPHCHFDNSESLGINPDAKEAILFAILANQTVAGEISKESQGKGLPAVSMGKVSFPF